MDGRCTGEEGLLFLCLYLKILSKFDGLASLFLKN